MNRLLEIGFEHAGHWILKDDRLACELARHAAARNILYAFVVDGAVKYVGKTVQPLQVRMSGYRTPAPSQVTNVKNNARIMAQLRDGAAVDILALPDNGLLHYGQFHINLAAGLEDAIIQSLSPAWNGRGEIEEATAREVDTGAIGAIVPLSLGAQGTRSFTLRLHKTYFARGFFNVGVEYESLFGNDGETIEIYCGSAERPIVGLINRTANSNRTPRILGGVELRQWFQRNLREMQDVAVS